MSYKSPTKHTTGNQHLLADSPVFFFHISF